MAINLYITSTQSFSGKSAVCVTLMYRMQKDSYRVGYLKPFSSAARVLAESSVDEDARFIKETFHLTEPLNILAPVVVTSQRIRRIFSEGGADYRQAVKTAAETIGQGKDIVVIEGSDNFREGYIVNLSLNEVADLVDAKVITVVGYQNSLQVVDETKKFYVGEGERYTGITADGKEASFEVVSANNIGAAGLSHRIGSQFAMPAGSYLINVWYYNGYGMTVYQISPKMIAA